MSIMHTGWAAGSLAVALLLAATACSDDQTGDGNDATVPDGTLDSGPEASVDAEAGVVDAEVYPDCEVPILPPEEIIPGELVRLPPTGEHQIKSADWDGQFVAYAAARCDVDTHYSYEVFMFDLASMQETAATDRLGGQSHVSVWSDSVAYVDNSFMADASPQNQYRAELFSYDVSTGNETRITDAPWPKLAPRFNGTHIAYLSDDEYPDVEGAKLVLREIASGDEIMLADRGQGVDQYICHDISEDYVSWMAVPPGETGYWDIFYHHIPTGITDRLHLDSPYLSCSSVSGTRIAWNEARSGNWDVFVMDLDTGIEEQVTTDPYDQIMMNVEGHFITWFDYRHIQGSFPGLLRDVHLYDMETGIDRRLTIDSSSWGILQPASCQWLVYVESFDDYHHKLYAWDLQAAGVLDGDCHVIPCDPATETCGVIEWRGM